MLGAPLLMALGNAVAQLMQDDCGQQDGRPTRDLSVEPFRDARHEHPWTPDTIVLFWSVTKGIGAACLLHVLQERGITLAQRVSEFWPEFAQNSKARITLTQLLSHQAGLAASRMHALLDHGGDRAVVLFLVSAVVGLARGRTRV